MTKHNKLVAIRTDGLVHETTFSGWFGETAAHKYFDELKEDKRTLALVIFAGIQSENSSDIVWHPRSSFNLDAS